MSKLDSASVRKAMEAKKARLLEQAAALDRDMAELERIVREHGLEISPKKESISQNAPASSSNSATQKRKRGAGKGTVSSLIDRYANDKGSPLHGLRFGTRQHYAMLLRRINESLGDQKLTDLKAEDFERVYEEWIKKSAERGRGDGIAMAHGLITMLRTLVNYGTTFPEPENGVFLRLSVVLHRIRFKTTKPTKTEAMSEEHVDKISSEAHKNKWHSLALAQTIQFHLGLHQRDVIGEWVPVEEPGMSDVHNGEHKWLRGLRWEEIDKDWVLRHVTSKKNEEIVIRLSDHPKILAEISKNGGRQSSGPVVINEDAKLPYGGFEFRRRWRLLARAVGLPEHIKNMNSRRTRKNPRSQDSASAEATA